LIRCAVISDPARLHSSHPIPPSPRISHLCVGE
jgi:hypothetical protein